jgi:hypothetical protein
MAFAGLVVLVPLAPIAAVAAAAERSEAQAHPRRTKKSAKKASLHAAKKHGFKPATKKNRPSHGDSVRFAKKTSSRKAVRRSAKGRTRDSKRPPK